MAAIPLWHYDRRVVRLGVHSACAFPLRMFLLGRAMRAHVAVSFGGRDARAHGGKFPSGRTWVAPVVASLSSGAGACTHVSQVFYRARDVRAMRAPMFASWVPGAQCVRPRSQVSRQASMGACVMRLGQPG